ncbi:MAG: 2Fe-2S iron-sulfur cluster binding domain-containing protein, partial [Deltaproteobacteria bacterium]|nr:2Fe-2S iron-sulfur cluster binding domain-containing protein [Deltaproteobacteria bacterium]
MPEPIHQVTFQPDNITVDVYRHGENLLRVAMAAGVHINASCGGNGTCGKCKVIIDKGKVESEHSEKLSDEQWQQGYRLACRTKVIDNLTITIPPESRIDNSALKRKTGGQRHILKARDLNTLVQGLSINPAVFKCYLELPPPTADDNMSDLGRLMREIKKSYKYDRISTDFHLLRRLSRVLRQADWKVTLTLVYNPKGFKLIDLEAGDTTKDNYSIIIDVGTTTVKGQLLNLEECQIALSSTNSADSENLCAEDARYNSQVGFGEDVISRIVHSQKKGGLEALQKAIIDDINEIIAHLLQTAGIENHQISHLVVAGNTTMTQLLLGIDPKYIREDPYVPTANFFPPVRAMEIGINLPDYIHLYTFPLVSSYVGGD